MPPPPPNAKGGEPAKAVALPRTQFSMTETYPPRHAIPPPQESLKPPVTVNPLKVAVSANLIFTVGPFCVPSMETWSQLGSKPGV